MNESPRCLPGFGPRIAPDPEQVLRGQESADFALVLTGEPLPYGRLHKKKQSLNFKKLSKMKCVFIFEKVLDKLMIPVITNSSRSSSSVW
jgi:hypothetical protein